MTMKAPKSLHDIPLAGRLFRSSVILFSLSFLVIVFGLLVQIALAAMLGTSRNMDAYLVAITVPAFLSNLSAASFVAALVPFFKQQAFTSDGSLPQIFTKLLLIILVIALGIVGVIILFAGRVVHFIAPGLEPSILILASDLLQIMILGSIFDILRGFLTAYYFSREEFFLPQFVPILNHCILLIGLLVFFRNTGLRGVAWAWSIGSLAMLLPMVVPIIHKGGLQITRQTFSLPVRNAWLLFYPSLIVIGLQQVNPFIDRFVASFLPVGAISFLGYASKVLEILMRTVPMSIGLAVFPLFSRQVLEQDLSALRGLVQLGVRWILLGTTPIAIFICLLREPIIRILFQRGHFDLLATRGVADILQWYALAFLPAGILYMLTNLTFAFRKQWIIAGLSLFGLCLTLPLELFLSRWFGPSGIAMASPVVSLLMVALLIFYLRRWLQIPPFLPEVGWWAKIILASTLTIGFFLVSIQLFPFSGRNFLSSIFILLLNGVLGTLVFYCTLYLSGESEIHRLTKKSVSFYPHSLPDPDAFFISFSLTHAQIFPPLGNIPLDKANINKAEPF